MQEEFPAASDVPFLSQEQVTEVENAKQYCAQLATFTAAIEAQLARYDTGEVDAATTIDKLNEIRLALWPD